jgi:hypothetical protein
MNILEIGNIFQSHYTREIKFLSNSYFLDADILVVDLDAVFMEFYELFVYAGTPYKLIKKDAFVKFLEQFEKRKEELQKYFKAGGNLLLFRSDRSRKEFKMMEGDTVIDSVLDFLTILGMEENKFETKAVSGHNVTNNDSYDVFFNEFYPTYEVVYSKYEGKPIAAVSKTNEPIAICVPIERECSNTT